PGRDSTRVVAWHRWNGRGRTRAAGVAVAKARIRTVGLVVRRDRPRAVRLARRMVAWLKRRRIRVLLDAESNLDSAVVDAPTCDKDALAREADLIVVLGGDGTL